MCGIAGVFAFRGEVDESLARRMSAVIRHRGPDDDGTYVAPWIAMASRRLAIVDLSPDGHMPMSNENNDLWVALNGEIYNHLGLRRQLENAGHRFKSHSDTETIVHGYEQWGIEVLNKIEGMFAVAIYDDIKGSLILARDRCGEKPLYMSEEDGKLIFASEIKAIQEVRNSPTQIDAQALSQYLTFGFVMPPATMFAGISKLAPGQAMEVKRAGSRLFTYWSPASDPDAIARVRSLSHNEHVRDIRRLLETSVAERMVADVPVGAFLSGGVDSSSVVALMSRLSGRRIETVTVANTDMPELDESNFAEQAAGHVGANFHRISLSERDVIANLSEMVHHFDEPISDHGAANSFFASKYLRQNGIIVSLVGEGADELFLGYGNYLRFAKLARLRIPPGLSHVAKWVGGPALSILGASVHKDLLSRLCSRETLFLGTETFFREDEKVAVLGQKRQHSMNVNHVVAAVHRRAPAALADDPLAIMSFAETQMRMAEKLLMRVDKMSMAHSIEVRAPFLDHRLVDYALSIPSSARVAGGVTKRILKDAVADLIPADIIHRKKFGFSTPIKVWFSGELGRYFEERIGTMRIFNDGVLDANAARDLVRAHRAQGRNVQTSHVKLWNILILAEWYERFEVKGIASTRPISRAA